MNDIFVSYAQADREAAQRIAGALERFGWSVFWDRRIPPGKTWEGVLDEQLRTAKCIVVLWSKRSAQSEWVKIEASKGRRRGVLVPAIIEDIGDEMPIEFSRTQAADLSDWDGSDDHAEFAALAEAIAERVPLSDRAPAREEHSKKPRIEVDEDVLGRDVRKRTTPSLFSRLVRLVRPRRSHHHVFVGYRRDLGAPVARLVSTELKSRGLRVFMDVESLVSGDYEERILNEVAQCPNFVLILTKDALTERQDDQGLFFKEIARALKTERTIVPVVMPDFSFPAPSQLPSNIADLPRHNAVAFSHEYFDAMIDKLRRYLSSDR